MNNTRKWSIVPKSLTAILLFGFACINLNCSKQIPASGRITDIRSNAHRYHKGEHVSINVEIENNSQYEQDYIVVANVVQGDLTIYDSHRGSKSEAHDGDECIHMIVPPLKRMNVGPFVFSIPNNAPVGVYEVLAGLRHNPWNPVVDTKGANWCPPACDIEIVD